MKKISLRFVFSEKGFHKKISKKLKFPKYYGNNLDALFDILTEFTFTKIVFINYKNFEKKVPNFVRKLKTLNENLISEGSSNIIEFM
ncbi:MAG: barstar family protein [Treponemataceae bacterium]|nr:barstar family protein [Treponemataceae bacterium]